MKICEEDLPERGFPWNEDRRAVGFVVSFNVLCIGADGEKNSCPVIRCGLTVWMPEV